MKKDKPYYEMEHYELSTKKVKMEKFVKMYLIFALINTILILSSIFISSLVTLICGVGGTILGVIVIFIALSEINWINFYMYQLKKERGW